MSYYKNTIYLNLNGEIWKDIEGYNGDYQVSNLGRIKSFKGKDITILRQDKRKGYLCVRLYKNGTSEHIYIHKLKFETFNNYKLKEDEVVHHIDENPINNYIDNLQKMTKFEHSSLHMSGENHYNYGKKCPEISKRMSGENHPKGMLGKHHSEESKKIMSEKMSGENNPNFGKLGKNISEKTKKLISKKLSGENNPNAILMEKQVIQIKMLFKLGFQNKEITKMFGVKSNVISKVKTGKTWKHIQI